MSRRIYTVVIEPDNEGQGYTVSVPALPGCISQGETLGEALDMVRDAIRLYLGVLSDRGEPIPNDVPAITIQLEIAEKVAA